MPAEYKRHPALTTIATMDLEGRVGIRRRATVRAQASACCSGSGIWGVDSGGATVSFCC